MDTSTLDRKTGLEKHQRGDLAGAEAVYRSILEVEPDHGGAWHLLGLVSFAKKQYRQAKTEIQRALALCGTKGVYWNNYGAVLRELGMAEEAKRACERALSIAPRYPDALSNLALCLRDLGEKDRAYHVFREVLAIDPGYRDALRHLAGLCQDLGRGDEAIELCNRRVESRDSYATWPRLRPGSTLCGLRRSSSARGAESSSAGRRFTRPTWIGLPIR